MSLFQLRTTNLGKSRTGLSGSVGYTVLDVSGNVSTSRTNTGVYELLTGSGMYAAHISFPSDFKGSVVWDSGQTPASKLVYATEEYNYQANNPNVDLILTKSCDISGTLNEVSGAVDLTKRAFFGRWQILTASNEMVFFAGDNTTELARFDLFDISGSAAFQCIFDRRRQ